MAKSTKLYAGIQDFINEIAEEEGITKKEAERLLRMFLKVFEKELVREDKHGVQIVDFLTFERVIRKEKLGRNPKKPEEIVMIPARVGFKVTLGQQFRRRLGS